MNNELKEAERVAFEAWARPVGFYLTRNEILGHYTNIDTTRAWEGWQARAALAQQPAQQDAQAIPDVCQGTNCGVADGLDHSPECIVETAEAQGWGDAPEAVAARQSLNAAPTESAQQEWIDDAGRLQWALWRIKDLEQQLAGRPVAITPPAQVAPTVQHLPSDDTEGGAI